MYCQRCGAQMPDGTKFCTACGFPMTADGAPRTTDAPATQPMPAPTPVPAPPRRRSTAAVVAGIAVAAVLIIGIPVALFATGVVKLPGQDEASDATTVELVGDAGNDADGEGESAPADGVDVNDIGAVAEPPAADSEPQPSSIPLDLSDSDDYGAINLFISNFTELTTGFGARDHFNRDEPLSDDQRVEIITYMLYHMSYNDNPYTEVVPADDPMADEGYVMRVKSDYFIDLLDRYFGIEFTESELAYDKNPGETRAPLADRGTARNGWFYYVYEMGVAWPSQGVAAVTSAEDLGSNRYRVTFDVYKPSDTLMPTDIAMDTYGLPLDKMLDTVGASSTPIYSGTAVVEARHDDGELAFTLYQMN